MDVVIRQVDGYGHIPIVKKDDGKEIYRGELQPTAYDALERCIDFISKSKHLGVNQD